jgi:hypothetical protein
MNLRSVLRVSTVLLVAATMACEKDDPVSIAPEQRFNISPLFVGIDPGSTQQVTATIGTNPVPVTWESSNTAVATVDANGLVTALTSGFAAVTATQVADPSQKISSNITVLTLQGTALTNNVPITISSSGARFSSVLYRLFVPPGKTNVTFTLTGGSGDADIFVARSVPPALSATGVATGAVCSSENGANAELCSINNPASGTWYVRVMVWDAYAGATLKGVYTP